MFHIYFFGTEGFESAVILGCPIHTDETDARSDFDSSAHPANSSAHRTAWHLIQTKDLSDTHLTTSQQTKIGKECVFQKDTGKSPPKCFPPNSRFLLCNLSGFLLVQVPHRTSDAPQNLTRPLKRLRFQSSPADLALPHGWWSAPSVAMGKYSRPLSKNPDTCLGNLEVEVTQSYKLSHNRMRGLFSKAAFFLNWCEHIYLKV